MAKRRSGREPGGWLVSLVSPPSAETAAERGVQATYLPDQANAEQLTQLASLLDTGVIRPVVAAVLPLAEARRAQELSESGHTRGKIILRVTE